MRQALIFIAALVVAAGEAAAQCSDEQAWQKPGAWSRGEDTLASDRALPDSARASALRKADAVVELLKQAIPNPKGLQAKVYRSRGAQSTEDSGPLKYGVTAFFLDYFCVPPTAGNRELRGKILLGDETATWIYINFNDLSQLVSPISNELRLADGSPMFSMPRSAGDFKGHGRYAWESGRGVQWEAIVVKAKDMRLTRDVTREDFLRAREKVERNEVAKLRESAASRPASSRSGIERSVQTLEGRLAKLVAARENMSAAERQQPAVIVNAHMGNRERMSFAAKGERGERLYALNPEFFDPQLPRHAIQFVTILLRWEANKPPKVEAMRRFRENFDLEALRALLGAT
jgi:hypothetical protein